MADTGDMNMQDQHQGPVPVADVENQQPPSDEPALQAADLEEKDINVIDWNGENDPENPRNWSAGKKWTNAGLLSAMTLITPLASFMFAPDVELVLREFHSTNSFLAALVLSIYVFGYCVGPLIAAPLSELYGRVPVYHVSNLLFVVLTIACAVSTNLNMLIAFRFLAGAGGSTAVTIGGGTFGDLFKAEERGAAISIWTMGPIVGPVIGPVCGGFLAQAMGWRWVFWLLSFLGSGLTVAMFIFLRETYPVVLLERKAARLRKSTGNLNLKSSLALEVSPSELFKRTIVRPIKMFISPIVLLLSIYMAFVYGILYLLLTTLTQVFTETYGFSRGISGLSYLGLGIGMIIGLVGFSLTSDKRMQRLAAGNGGVMKPEYRFPPMIPASFLIPAGLFIYGWTAEYAIHWIVPIMGMGLVGLGIMGTNMPISAYLIDAFTIHSASALAANTILRSLFGAFLPLAGPALYGSLGLGWGNSLLAFIAVAMIPIPVCFWRYGERLRTSRRLKVEL
ncbi:Efflux pump [Lachnellula occidentalis]|uniref:Efflux pump n=1 Tax=Lachnellula occidentalis TaxID=215460 RepID=A0A8H8REP1_9HELO|nr:Efflux pump [Lachnellula occidentalis]